MPKQRGIRQRRRYWFGAGDVEIDPIVEVIRQCLSGIRRQVSIGKQIGSLWPIKHRKRGLLNIIDVYLPCGHPFDDCGNAKVDFTGRRREVF